MQFFEVEVMIYNRRCNRSGRFRFICSENIDHRTGDSEESDAHAHNFKEVAQVQHPSIVRFSAPA